MRKICFIFFIVSFVCSCSDLSLDCNPINNKYFFCHKGKGKRLIEPQNAISKNTIYPDVVSHFQNDSFVVAKQILNLDYLKNHLGEDLYFRFVSYGQYLKNPNIVNSNVGGLMKGVIENDSINYKMFLDRNATENKTARDYDIGLEIADSLIKNDSFYRRIVASKENYWVINLITDTLIGPMDKQDYLEFCKKSKLPTDFDNESN